MTASDRDVRASLLRLRADAIKRGYLVYAIALGQSVIRLGMSAIEAELAQFKPWRINP